MQHDYVCDHNADDLKPKQVTIDPVILLAYFRNQNTKGSYNLHY